MPESNLRQKGKPDHRKRQVENDKHVKTYHDGANEERSCWMRKIRKEFRYAESASAKTKLAELITFGRNRNERYKKNPGGL